MSDDMPNQREAVLLAILVGKEKFGRQVRDEYERRTNQPMPLGSLYTTMDRLQAKGFITSWLGEATPERGTSRRRYFRITGSGIDALNALTAAMGLHAEGAEYA